MTSNTPYIPKTKKEIIVPPVQPKNNKLLTIPLEKREEKIGSIIIPGTVNVEIEYALVVLCTDEMEHLYKPGDVLMHPKGTGQGQYLVGKTFLWLQLGEIYGIYTEDNEK